MEDAEKAQSPVHTSQDNPGTPDNIIPPSQSDQEMPLGPQGQAGGSALSATNVPRQLCGSGRSTRLNATVIPLLLVLALIMSVRIKASKMDATVAETVSSKVPALGVHEPEEPMGVGEVALVVEKAEEKIGQPLPSHPEPQWLVEPVETDEDRKSPLATFWKELLAVVVENIEKNAPEAPTAQGEEIMEELASALSAGESKKLIGMSIALVDAIEVTDSESSAGPKIYTVTNFLGEGEHSVVVEVRDAHDGPPFAMRVNLLLPHERGHVSESERSVAYAQAVHSIEATIDICDATPISKVGSEKGISISRMIATIQGIPEILEGEKCSILSRVEIMDRLHTNLEAVLRASNLLPTGWKAYLARTVLKTVLHLQHRGWSHNQINSSSFLFKEDGFPILTGFESSSKFGERLPREAGLSPRTTDPAFLAEFLSETDSTPLFTSPATDMWSLGLLLYEIMMGGELPFGLSDLTPDSDVVAQVLQLRETAEPSTLSVVMTEHGINNRWQKLIMGLLNPDQRQRISAEKIAEEFSDLLHGTIELELYDVTSPDMLHDAVSAKTEQKGAKTRIPEAVERMMRDPAESMQEREERYLEVARQMLESTASFGHSTPPYHGSAPRGLPSTSLTSTRYSDLVLWPGTSSLPLSRSALPVYRPLHGGTGGTGPYQQASLRSSYSRFPPSRYPSRSTLPAFGRGTREGRLFDPYSTPDTAVHTGSTSSTTPDALPLDKRQTSPSTRALSRFLSQDDERHSESAPASDTASSAGHKPNPEADGGT
ncbi:hypothetical protein cyc_02713 [Cyclospora cayetanensis]|uniref:non-specific serine/threonine protein kinase n=1 Tax=Cyclospora cayetanensis TaxID=88456 RepID=A0A1D3CVQ9_9EIME|nr:hypothetical protein cyc_02713 [Cyclospora cayetanensis]